MTRTIQCLAAVVAGLSLPASAQTPPAGWSPVWADEFGTSSVNTLRWEVLNRRDSYNNEKQYYTPDQVTQSGGTLNLTATNVPLDGKAYRSGLVRTWQERTYGRWEIRASLPSGQGMWPAVWLLPRNADWPSGGEIDIMENRGSEPGTVGQAFHYGPNVAAHQYAASSFGYASGGQPVSFHHSMHTYAVEWDAGRIRYLVDDIPAYTLYGKNVPVSSTPMSLILNLAVGGDYGGDPNAGTTFPKTMSVDYVRVFQRDAATSALANTSFEQKADSVVAAWDEYSNGFNVVPDSVAANARSGSGAVQMFGRFNGSADNVSGLHQEVPTAAGEVWQLGGFGRNRPGDKLVGLNGGRFKVEFLNANGIVIGSKLLTVVDAGSPEQYRESVLRATAPAGAAFVRAVLEMRQVNNAGGAVNFDDATLRRFTAGSAAGDTNLDGTRDSADIDALLHSLTADNTAFDYNANGVVNGADVDAYLATAFGTFRGDFNLDRAVNFADFVLLQAHFGEVGTGQWASGDANGDSTINFADFVLLQTHYGQGAANRAETAAAFYADWERAKAVVPEPATAAALAAFAGLGLTARRRKA